jgi:23S rRNA (cytidine1920-2'-O)/16S rRNA (cytidine1409-2'-O)-methyltransferase
VIALDVGYGQLAERLRIDSRVTVIDRTNVRLVQPGQLPYPPDLVVVDTSFISLKLVLPPLVAVVAPGADLIVLIKPQFEVGKGKVGKGGIVRDPGLHEQAVAGVIEAACALGLQANQAIGSPITGASGNREFLAHFRHSGG